MYLKFFYLFELLLHFFPFFICWISLVFKMTTRSKTSRKMNWLCHCSRCPTTYNTGYKKPLTFTIYQLVFYNHNFFYFFGVHIVESVKTWKIFLLTNYTNIVDTFSNAMKENTLVVNKTFHCGPAYQTSMCEFCHRRAY